MKKDQSSPHFNLTGVIPEFPDYTPSSKAFDILNNYCNLDSEIEAIKGGLYINEGLKVYRFLEELKDGTESVFTATNLYETHKLSSISQEEKEILRRESRSLVEYYCQISAEHDYLWNGDIIAFTKEQILFILSIVQWGKETTILDRFASCMPIQLYRPDGSFSAIFPDLYDTYFDNLRILEDLDLLSPETIHKTDIYDNMWSFGYGSFNVIVSNLPGWDYYYNTTSNDAGHWLNYNIENHLKEKGILVCLLPTDLLMQRDNRPSTGLDLLIRGKYIRMIIDLPKIIEDEYDTRFTNYSMIFLSKENNDEIIMVDGKDLFFKTKHSFFDYSLDWKKLVKVISDKDENYVSVISHDKLQDFKSLSPAFYINYSRFCATYTNELQYCKQLWEVASVSFNFERKRPQKRANVITPKQLSVENTCEIHSYDGEKDFPFARIDVSSYLLSFHRQIISSGYYRKEIEQTELYTDKNVCSIIFPSIVYMSNRFGDSKEDEVKNIVEDFLLSTQNYFRSQLPDGFFEFDAIEIDPTLTEVDIPKDSCTSDDKKRDNDFITIDYDIFMDGSILYRKEIVTKLLDDFFEAKKALHDEDEEYVHLLKNALNGPSEEEELNNFLQFSSFKKHHYFIETIKDFYEFKGGNIEKILFQYLMDNNPQLFHQIMTNDFIFKQLLIMGTEWKLMIKKLYIPVCNFEKFISHAIKGVSRIRIQRNTDKIKLNSSKGFYNIIVESIDKDPVILDLGWAGKILFIAALIKNMKDINLSKYNKDKNCDLVLLEEVNSLLYPQEKATDISVLFDPVSRTKRVSDANKKIEEVLGKDNPCCIQIHTDISNSRLIENSAVSKRTTYASIKFPRYKCIFPPEFNNILDENIYEFDKALINYDLKDFDTSKETLTSRDKTQLMV